MFRCPILYCKHHALVHYFYRSIFVSTLSDALWTQQDSQTSRAENFLRLAAVYCNELAAKPNVFKGWIALDHVKIIWHWNLLIFTQDHASVLVDGTCQIPDPVYKLVGSIVCFYIPLGVMLLTYTLTVRLLARQSKNLGGGKPSSSGGWSSGWLGVAPPLGELKLHNTMFTQKFHYTSFK